MTRRRRPARTVHPGATMRLMGAWSDHVVPRLVDRMGDPQDLRADRAQVCAGLEGHVLEIGFGSGVNLQYYPSGVTAVTAVEPNAVARRLAAGRLAAHAVPVAFAGDDAADLPFPDNRFDAVLSTLTLCTIPDPAAAIAEIYRVTKPGRAFSFLEHGLAPDPAVRRWQRRLEPLQKRLLDGCHLTRDIRQLVAESHFALEEVQQSYLPGPAAGKPFGATYRGRARKAA